MNPTLPQPTPVAPTSSGMDQGAINLAKAIRQTESGGNFNAKGASGETGAYQWTAPTWQAHATQILGDPNAPMTPANQNAVAYGVIKSWKDSGLNAAEIAAKWNSGSPTGWENKIGTNSQGVKYNVPQYVKSVTDAYQTIKAGGNVGVDPNNPSSTAAPQTPQDNSGALFPSSPNDNGLVAGLKAAGNTVGSAFNFAKGVVSSLNPLNTLKNLSDIATQASQSTPGELLDTVTGLPQAAFNTLIPTGVKQVLSGDIAGAAKSFTNDPFGQTAPIVLATIGGAKLADTYGGGLTKAADANMANFTKTGVNVMPSEGVYSKAVDNGISKIADIAKPLTSVVTAPLSLAGGIAKSAASHLLGLEPTDITNIIKNPEAFSKIAQDQASRGGLANEFGNSIDTLETKLQDTGEGYNPIRTITNPVAVPENFIGSVLNKPEFRLKLENGQVVADSNSVTRNPSDIRAVQNFVDNWGNKTELTPNEYLNMRKDIAGIAKFGKDIGTNVDAQKIGTALYEEANRTIRPQIKGLKELDNTYSPIKQQFDQIKKDFLVKGNDGEYTFKDGAINRIANATGVGKDALLSRMEQILPGIGKKIQILKTIESIQKAYGNKVGTYARGILEGGGILTGNIPAIIASIISNPTIAVPLLRGLGYGISQVAPIVSALKIVAGDVNNFNIGGQKGAIPSPYMNPKIGFGNGIQLTLEQANELRANHILKLPAPVSSIKLGGAKDASQVIMIKAGKIVNQAGDVVGYSSTGQDIKVKGTDTPYTKTDELPVIQFGKKAVPKESGLPTVDTAPNVAMPIKGVSPLSQEALKYKSAEEFVKAQRDPLLEFNKLGTVKDGIGGGTVKEAINDIGGIDNVTRGVTDINKLETTEKINTNSQRYKTIEAEVKSGKITPIITDEYLRVVDGHHRLEVYKAMGMKDVPVIVPKETAGVKFQTKSQLTDIWNKAHKKK